jgi:hypothetical protein
MAAGFGAGVAAALQAFLLYGLIRITYVGAKFIAPETTPFKLVWKGFLGCGVFAAIGGAMLGEPCSEIGDSINGRCDSYADEGRAATGGQRMKHGTNLFLLTFLPIMIVANNERIRRRELKLVEKYSPSNTEK